MSENNGKEAPKFAFVDDSEDEQIKLALPSVILGGPAGWVDGMTFKLRRRSENRWRLTLESSPASIVDLEAPTGLPERG